MRPASSTTAPPSTASSRSGEPRPRWFHRPIQDTAANREGTALASRSAGRRGDRPPFSGGRPPLAVRRSLSPADGGRDLVLPDRHRPSSGSSMRFIAEFYLTITASSASATGREVVIRGGSRTYIEALLRRWNGECPAATSARGRRSPPRPGRVEPRPRGRRLAGDVRPCRLRLPQRSSVVDPARSRRHGAGGALGFHYSRNIALLHTDRRFLPRRRRALGPA